MKSFKVKSISPIKVKSIGPITITVVIAKQLRIRMVISILLFKLGAWVLGGKADINVQ